MRYAGGVISGRTLESFDENELRHVRAQLENAETVYRQMYRGRLRNDFEKIFLVDEDQFEAGILLLKRFLGAE